MRLATHSIAHVELKHITWFVHGAVYAWCDQTNGIAYKDKELRDLYVQDTVNLVIAYMKGERDLDGRCSDLQVVIASEAKAVFRPVPVKIDGGTCEFCGEPNLAHMSGPCAEQRRRGL